MNSQKEKLRSVAAKRESQWREAALQRSSDAGWRKLSFLIALRILRSIRDQKPVNGMTQKKLAEIVEVSPQYINKVVKGRENLTLETIVKIEKALGIALIEIPGLYPIKDIGFRRGDRGLNSQVNE